MIRAAYLRTARSGRDLVAAPEVSAAWDAPSALREFTVRGLAGHLVRAATVVEPYLDRDEPDGPVVGPAVYFGAVTEEPDIGAEIHRRIREGGEGEAAQGQAALVARYDASIERLERRLPGERADRRVRAFRDFVLTLDDFLVTRCIELLVHIDDLAVSVGLPTPVADTEAMGATITALVDAARLRHGDLAVLRALTRRERDSVEALRVL